MRKLMLPALAACALLAAGAPAAGAKAQSASLGGKLSTVSGALKGLQKAVKQMKDINDGQTGAINGVDTRVTTVVANLTALSNKVDAIVAVATDSLTKLQAGLLALKDGLTTAGAGLTSLKTLATSTEYGIGQVLINGTAAPGSFVATPDIPDAVQPATVTSTFVAGASGVLDLAVGVRSAESDGTGASDPAASCRATIVSANNSSTSAPNATKFGLGAGSPPFWDIATKSPQTSTTETSFPFAPISTDNLTNLTGASNSVDPTATPATATAGLPYTVTLTCIDLTPSTSDPSA